MYVLINYYFIDWISFFNYEFYELIALYDLMKKWNYLIIIKNIN